MTMARHAYTILLTPEPDGSAYNVTVPALPGCLTWGTTVEEAVERAGEAISLWLESLAAHGEPIPVETTPPSLTVVAVEVAAPTPVGA
jgi:antitoxin HicB